MRPVYRWKSLDRRYAGTVPPVQPAPIEGTHRLRRRSSSQTVLVRPGLSESCRVNQGPRPEILNIAGSMLAASIEQACKDSSSAGPKLNPEKRLHLRLRPLLHARQVPA